MTSDIKRDGRSKHGCPLSHALVKTSDAEHVGKTGSSM